MKKKQPEVIQLPIPTFKLANQQFWQYELHDYQELDQYINQTPNLETLLPKSYSVQEAFLNICEYFKIPPHPSIVPKQIRLFPSQGLLIEQSGDQAQNIPQTNQFIIFQNTRIDCLTLRLLEYLWPQFSNLTVLKLYHVELEATELELLQRIIQKNKIDKLSLEYMKTLPSIQNLDIKQLYLRNNNLTFEYLSELLTQPLNKLQVLELSSNPLGHDELKLISDFIGKRNSLQYLGLSSVNRTWEELKLITDKIGIEKLSSLKLEAYRENEIQRENQIKELKAKKKDIPFDIEVGEQVLQNPDNSYSLHKNHQLQILNLSLNEIRDSDLQQIEKFLQANPGLVVYLIHSHLESKTKEKLKKKYNFIRV